MKYLLDTNICIYIIKKKPEQVINTLSKMDPSTIAISAVTWSELIYGVEKSQTPEKNHQALSHFITPFEILPWTEKEAYHCGEIRAKLSQLGTPIGPFDCQIAGHALALNLTLVTNNEKEFRRVDGLKIINWVNKQGLR